MQCVENESVSLFLFGTGRPRVLQCLGGLNNRLEENRSINGCGIKVFQTDLWKRTQPGSVHSTCWNSSEDESSFHASACFWGFRTSAGLLQLLLFSSLKNLPVQLPHVSGAVFLPPVSHREGFRRAPIAGMACSTSACFRKLRLDSIHQMERKD